MNHEQPPARVPLQPSPLVQGVERHQQPGPPRDEPMMALEIELAGQRLRSVSTLASFGTALDVAMEELRIEHYFPADEATRRWFRNQIQ